MILSLGYTRGVTDLAPLALTPNSEPDRSVATNLDPTADEVEIAQMVRDLFQTARAARAPMIPIWNRCWRALRCRTRTHTPGAAWEPNIRIPEIFNIVRTKVGLELDQRIVTKISPAGPFGSEWASWLAQRCSDMEAVMESSHFVNHEEIQYELALWDAATYGTAIVKTVWDGALADGKGDAVIRRVNPYCFVPDPAATNEDDGDYYIEAHTWSVQQIDRMFPGKGELFLRGGASDSIDDPPSQLSQSGSQQSRLLPGPISPATSPRYGREVGGGSTQALHADPVVVLEAWIREHDVTEVKGGPEDGRTIVEDKWRVVMVAGPHVLLNERADELWGHGGHPYDRYVPQDLGEFWGIGIVELLGPIQASLNRMLQAVQRHIEITGNPILKEEYGATTQNVMLNGNKPGQRLSKKRGSEVDWMQPPSMSPQLPLFLEFVRARMEAVSGLSAMARGGMPQGRPSSDVMDSVQEMAFVTVRAELLNLEHALRGAYLKKAALIAENYTEPRFVSITGPQGEPSSMFLSARHFSAPVDEQAALEYQVRVDAGSSSYTSRKVRHDLATQALTLGAIDRLSWLEAVEFPNPQLVLQRKAAEESSILAANPPGRRERARA